MWLKSFIPSLKQVSNFFLGKSSQDTGYVKSSQVESLVKASQVPGQLTVSP